MLLWTSLNYRPLNLLIVRNHQTQRIIVKGLIRRRNSVTTVLLEPRSCDQGRPENDAFALSTALPRLSFFRSSSQHFGAFFVLFLSSKGPSERQVKHLLWRRLL